MTSGPVFWWERGCWKGGTGLLDRTFASVDWVIDCTRFNEGGGGLAVSCFSRSVVRPGTSRLSAIEAELLDAEVAGSTSEVVDGRPAMSAAVLVLASVIAVSLNRQTGREQTAKKYAIAIAEERSVRMH